jgi:hypothetical protein
MTRIYVTVLLHHVKARPRAKSAQITKREQFTDCLPPIESVKGGQANVKLIKRRRSQALDWRYS